jgi:predicted nucleotide-binding protein
MNDIETRGNPRVLWIEDDILSVYPVMEAVRDHGIDVVTASDAAEAMETLQNDKGGFDVILLDVIMEPGQEFTPKETRGGFFTGIALGRRIKASFPEIPIIGVTVAADEAVQAWFDSFGYCCLTKPVDAREIILQVRKATGQKVTIRQKPRIFVVHGHDHSALYELKNYIQNTLDLGEPIILREQPSLGKTIIEKFEDEARNVDIAFVLLTPDDIVVDKSDSDSSKRRARQNVIFELGYFYAKLQRRRGNVLLLHSGNLEIPSDISGILYIDVTNGIEAAGEEIRRELKEWLE